MHSNALAEGQPKPGNVIPLKDQKPRPGRIAKSADVLRQRFRILTFTNASGTIAYRVQGMGREGYVRMNFSDLRAAEAKRLQLENEYLRGNVDGLPLPRMTTLNDGQLRLAETVFERLRAVEAADGDILQAVEAWTRAGRKLHLADCPRVDEAVRQFVAWVKDTPTLRDRTKANLRIRIEMFANGVANMRVDGITADTIEAYLAGRKVAPASKDNDKRVIGRFLSWCIERPRRWLTVNPASEVHVEQGEKGVPAILTVGEAQALMRAAESLHGGALAPYCAVCLFGGLRPQEASRLRWAQVNLHDRELRLEGEQTKTKRPRVVTIGDTLHAWLKRHKDKPFLPSNWRRGFDAVKAAAGYGGRKVDSEEGPRLKPWPEDVMRHTAISHRFRETGSYGLTAEWAGNSEAIIKMHYQGRVTTEDTKAFLAILPAGKAKP